jgi:hypothetical protein
MKRILMALLLVCLPALAVRVEAQNYSAVTASGIRNGGTLVPLARVCFLGTNNQDQSINFQVGGGGLNGFKPFCASVTNGAVAGGFQVPNPANTLPAGIYYHITIKDSNTQQVFYDEGCVSFSGAGFNMDLHTPVGCRAGAFTPPVGASVNGPFTVNGNFTVTGTGTIGTLAVTTATVGTLAVTKLTGYDAWVNMADDCAGVVHDGTTDDGAALATCITANPKKLLYFPCFANASGYDYYSTQALTIVNNFILGCGSNYGNGIGTRLKFAPATSGLILTGGGVTVQNINVIGGDPAHSSAAQSEAANLLIPSGASMTEYSQAISTVSRAGGVTTVRFTNVPHWYPVNGIVSISGVSDTSFNGTFYISTTAQAVTGGASSFTYAQAGAPDVVQASLGGTVGLATTYTAFGDGITIQQTFQHLQNVAVENFGRYGILAGGGATFADDFQLDNVHTTRNRAHGFKCSGGDCNAGSTLHLRTYLNGLWGIFDIGFLGNTHIAPQASYNNGARLSQ